MTIRQSIEKILKKHETETESDSGESLNLLVALFHKSELAREGEIEKMIGKQENERYKECPTKAHNKHEYCCYIGNICLEAHIKNKFRKDLLAKLKGTKK